MGDSEHSPVGRSMALVLHRGLCAQELISVDPRPAARVHAVSGQAGGWEVLLHKTPAQHDSNTALPVSHTMPHLPTARPSSPWNSQKAHLNPPFPFRPFPPLTLQLSPILTSCLPSGRCIATRFSTGGCARLFSISSCMQAQEAASSSSVLQNFPAPRTKTQLTRLFSGYVCSMCKQARPTPPPVGFLTLNTNMSTALLGCRDCCFALLPPRCCACSANRFTKCLL